MGEVLFSFTSSTLTNPYLLSNAIRTGALGTQTATVLAVLGATAKASNKHIDLSDAIEFYETAQTREAALASLRIIADILQRDAHKLAPLLAKASGNFLSGTKRFQSPEKLRAELTEAFKYQTARVATISAYFSVTPGNGKASLTASAATIVPDRIKRIWKNSPALRSYKLPPGEKDPVFHAVSFLISKKNEIDTELGKKFSFDYLMQVLTTQKKVSGNPQPYQRAGSALDLFFADGNPMQHLEKGELKTPEEAVRWILKHKQTLDSLAKRIEAYSYETLMNALSYAGRVKGDPQTYRRAGSALDLFFAKGNPMRHLKKGGLKTPEEAVRWILNHKQELDALAKNVETYSYVTLVNALVYSGIVQGNSQAYKRAGSALDLFLAKGNPMQHLEKGELKTPEEAVRWILKHKQTLDSLAKRIEAYSYATLMNALYYAGRVKGDPQTYRRAGSALDLFFAKGNPMQHLKEGELKTPEEAVLWILNHKQTLDSLAKNVGTYSYVTLMNALFHGGRVQGNLQPYYWAGGAIQYLFKKWDPIGPLVLKVYQGEKMSPQERDQFTTLKGDRPIGKHYRNVIIRWGCFLIENRLNP